MDFRLFLESKLPLMYHGSTQKREVLQAGSMLTTHASWAAGYTTKFKPTSMEEMFVGLIHVVQLNPQNDYLIPGSLHDAETFLINYQRKLKTKPGRGLSGLAKAVHEETEWDALVASFRGEVVGAITLVDVKVIGYLDPVEVLKNTPEEYIPDNLRRALNGR